MRKTNETTYDWRVVVIELITSALLGEMEKEKKRKQETKLDQFMTKKTSEMSNYKICISFDLNQSLTGLITDECLCL
ncbi:CLUMA_CG001258, isoform A [Clunio marinus]|uniref:CLUMA_CG001258, isoform A n=1 Tax=Clunio marinus TaxID=568069 RepID=A0A1J1HMJ2_9DIPT|nr:CLUMA_CG001258, isoform A [Clunio marinus]